MANKEASFGSEPMRTIEQHQLTRGTPAAVHAGAMARAGWYSGKMVTEKEYDAAVAAFGAGAKERGGKRA